MLLALKETPDHFLLHRHLSVTYLRNGDNMAAAAHALWFVEAAQREGLHPAEVSEGMSCLARALRAQGNLQDALRAWGDAWKACPARREPVWEAAHALSAAGMHKEACWALEDLLAIPKEGRPEYHHDRDECWGDDPARLLVEWKAKTGENGGHE